MRPSACSATSTAWVRPRPRAHTGFSPTGGVDALIPKATPTPPDDPNIWRVRYDTIHNNEAIISTRETGEVIADFTLNPAHGYRRKNG